jgi:hypothetical protein
MVTVTSKRPRQARAETLRLAQAKTLPLIRVMLQRHSQVECLQVTQVAHPRLVQVLGLLLRSSQVGLQRLVRVQLQRRCLLLGQQHRHQVTLLRLSQVERLCLVRTELLRPTLAELPPSTPQPSSKMPTGHPSRAPTGHPSRAPTPNPRRAPTGHPSRAPTPQPSRAPRDTQGARQRQSQLECLQATQAVLQLSSPPGRLVRDIQVERLPANQVKHQHTLQLSNSTILLRVNQR